MKTYLLIPTLLLLSTFHLSAQVSVSTDNSPADNSAILDVKSTNKGVVFPRMTRSQISAISNPTNGLVVFCTTDNKFYAFVASARVWKEILYGTGTILSIPTNGLIAWYPFNGNASDESGNGNNGTVNGASLATDRFGNPNRAYRFNGMNGYICTSTINTINLSGQSFSFSVWLKKDGIPLGAILVQGSANTNVGLHLTFVYNYLFRFGFYWNDLDAPEQNADTSNWWHYCGTYDAANNQRKLYLNGNLISADAPLSDYLGNGVIYIGGTPQINGWQQGSFYGKLDDIGIWNRILSDDEILQLYHEGGW